MSKSYQDVGTFLIELTEVLVFKLLDKMADPSEGKK